MKTTKILASQKTPLTLARETLKNLTVKTTIRAGNSGTYCAGCGTGTKCPQIWI